MTKNLSIKWNADRQDPDTINQYGIEFPANEFVPVPADHPKIDKFKGNKFFEIKGYDRPDENPDANTTPHRTSPSVVSVVTYSVQRVGNGKGKPSTYIVVGRDAVTGNNIDGPKDEYADEESAQTVADALNQTPAPPEHH